MSSDLDWADQLRSEIESQATERAAKIESLLISADYLACREWLDEWASEDESPDSIQYRYQAILQKIRSQRFQLSRQR